MAALPPVPKTVRIDWHWVWSGGSVAQNRMFFNYSGTLSAADAVTWVAGASAAVVASGSIQGALSNDYTLVKTQLTDLSSNVAPQATDNTQRAGSVPIQSVPVGVACVASFKIARRYRGGHPRLYIGGINNGALTSEDAWSSVFPGNFRGSVSQWISSTIGAAPSAVGTVTHVNVHYFSGFTNKTFPSGRIRPVPTPLSTPGQDLVTDVIINPRPASQRRRNRQGQ